jgi:hypothetical protein
MVAEDRVLTAAHSYVSRALSVVRERCPAADDRPFEMGFTHWVEEPGGGADFRSFVLVPDIWSAAKVCAGRVLGDLRLAGMPEFELLAEALRDDPIIGPRLGDEIVAGAGVAGGPLQIPSLADALVLDLLEGSETELTPRPEAIQQAIDRWLRYLRRMNDEITVLSPLSLVSLEDRQVDLSSGTTISEMSGDEIAAALRMDALPATTLGGTRHLTRAQSRALVRRTFALRLSFTTPLIVGPGNPKQSQATVDTQEEAIRRAEDVLLALRVLKRGPVAIQSHLVVKREKDGLSPMMSKAILGPFALSVLPYALTSVEAMALRELSNQFTIARSHGGRTKDVIDIATRRFGYAADRVRPDDEIVDLAVAAESLYLNDLSGDRGELAYRLATRAALFADGNAEARRRVLAFMRKAYTARSVVVHTGKLPHSLRTIGGDQATPEEFADDLEDVLRQALRKTLRLIASGERYPPDWDALMLAPFDAK